MFSPPPTDFGSLQLLCCFAIQFNISPNFCFDRLTCSFGLSKIVFFHIVARIQPDSSECQQDFMAFKNEIS